MRHRLFTIASAVSLVFCLAAIAIAGVSFWHGHVFWVSRVGNYISGRGTGEYGNYDDNRYFIQVSRGALGIGYDNRRLPNPVARAWQASHQGFHHAGLPRQDIYNSVNYPKVEGLGFKYGLTVYKAGGFLFGRTLIIPFWFIILVLATPSTTVFVRHMRSTPARRHAAGLCPACAYDLRGNTSGVCPECGTAVSQKTKVIT